MSVQLFCRKCRRMSMFLIGATIEEHTDNTHKRLTCECCKKIHVGIFAREAA